MDGLKIVSIEQVTPQALTAIFRQLGSLPHDEVVQVEMRPVHNPAPGVHAQRLFHLALQYEGTDSAAPPEQLFLKFSKSNKEPYFHSVMAPEITACLSSGASPLFACYYAGHDPQTDTACLIFEDLEHSHYQTEWPLLPSEELTLQSVQVLAVLHALWWDSPRLENDFRPALPPERSWQARNASALEKLAAFLEFLGDFLSSPRRAIFEKLISCQRLPWELAPGAPGQTLLHGDFHFWNVLYPVDPECDRLRIFDWNMWDVGRPSDDLAYLIGLHWYPERRARFERSILSAYHKVLTSCGLADFSWDDFWQDYRLSILRSLLIPVWQWNRGISPAIWLPHLELGLMAAEDLKCQDFL